MLDINVISKQKRERFYKNHTVYNQHNHNHQNTKRNMTAAAGKYQWLPEWTAPWQKTMANRIIQLIGNNYEVALSVVCPSYYAANNLLFWVKLHFKQKWHIAASKKSRNVSALLKNYGMFPQSYFDSHVENINKGSIKSSP